MNALSVTVTLAADEVRLFGGTIATNAEAADGGSVTIEAKDLVHLDAGVITAAVRDGDGGNITNDPEVVILQNGSQIVADAGTGGNILITADKYFAFPGSVVNASSELGIDGIVEVSTPDVDLAATLTALPASYLDAASLMRERCAARRSGERAGSFAVRGNGGIPAEPDGWLPATLTTELERGLAPTSRRSPPLRARHASLCSEAASSAFVRSVGCGRRGAAGGRRWTHATSCPSIPPGASSASLSNSSSPCAGLPIARARATSSPGKRSAASSGRRSDAAGRPSSRGAR